MNISNAVLVVPALLALAFNVSAEESTNLFSVKLGDDWYLQPMLRQKWTDILDNGGSLPTGGNIQGATISYSRDGVADTESWSAVGAGIVSLSYSPVTTCVSGLHLLQAALGPTVAFNQVRNSTHSNNVDHLYFALAGGCQWAYGTKQDPYGDGALTLGLAGRAGFVYDTDSRFHAELPGGFVELEPQFLYRWVNSHANWPWMALGWNNKVGALSDGTALFLLQIRAWLHLEGGDIQRSGTDWNVVQGSFFRLGPEVKCQITVPKLRDLSLSAEYDYTPAVTGPAGQDYLYSFAASFPLSWFSVGSSSRQPVAVTASYTKGGLILSKQAVDTFTLGLSLTL